MRKIEGTATISIEELDELREREQWHKDLMRKVKMLVEKIDTSEYDKKHEEIDLENTTDRKLEKLLKEAVKSIKIIVSEKTLRNLIHEYIDDTKSNAHYMLSEMSEKEFGEVKLIFANEAGGQQERSVCEMCEEYMADAECELKDSCPAAGIIKELKEAQEQVKTLKKQIKDKDTSIRELKKQVDDLRLEKSYMIDPNAIGDRHEMGG